MSRLLSLLALCLLTLPASAAPRYAITNLGTLGGSYSDALGVNNNGQVVGISETAIVNHWRDRMGRDSAHILSHAFLWQNGKMQDLDKANAQTDSTANAINSKGEIVGQRGNEAAYWQDGTLHLLPPLQVGSNNWGSVATAISDNGQIVGASRFNACLWQNGKPVDLGDLGSGQATASAINENGEIIGGARVASKISGEPPPPGPTHAFLWSSGRMQDLGSNLPYENDNSALCIATDGRVYGHNYNNPYLSKHLNYTTWADGRWEQVAGFTNIQACNHNSDLVGQNVSVACARLHGTVYDLNQLLPARSGWTIGTASAINDKGWIVGNGTHNGKVRAFLLRPQK